MDVKDFLDQASSEAIARKIAELALQDNDDALRILYDFLLIKDFHTFHKHEIPRLTCRALIQKGAKGIEILKSAAKNAESHIYRTSIIEALWYAAQGKNARDMVISLPIFEPLHQPPPPEAIAPAREAFYDLVMESHINVDIFSPLMQFLFTAGSFEYLSKGPENSQSFRSAVFSIFTEATIKITRRIIEEFQNLIEAEQVEEVYQEFLKQHPVLIDPLASEIIPKQRLGIDYITDFVVRRLDNEYILVEIERPQDEIFTSGNDFTARFTHAFGQVIDFQEWVGEHSEYARSLMPDISSPRGLVLIGRRNSLTQKQIAKLKRFCINSKSVEVATYDDLLTKAKNLYWSIHSRASADIFG